MSLFNPCIFPAPASVLGLALLKREVTHTAPSPPVTASPLCAWVALPGCIWKLRKRKTSRRKLQHEYHNPPTEDHRFFITPSAPSPGSRKLSACIDQDTFLGCDAQFCKGVHIFRLFCVRALKRLFF